jgi:hypothetical protein
MTISAQVRQLVRRRSNFACEFCGVTETDTGGELSVDHLFPIAAGGDDDEGNLVYCCFRCNFYKADYSPSQPSDASLWNPRKDAATVHFASQNDGRLLPLTMEGRFTVQRLRLNRPALVAHRLRRQQSNDNQRLLERYRELEQLWEERHRQHIALLEEQQQLLRRQSELLRRLLPDET